MYMCNVRKILFIHNIYEILLSLCVYMFVELIYLRLKKRKKPYFAKILKISQLEWAFYTYLRFKKTRILFQK